MPVEKSSPLVYQSTRCGRRASTASGVILECNERGAVLAIPRDDLGLLHEISPGLSFHHLVDRESLDKAFAFLAELIKQKSAFGWKLNFSLASEPTILYVGGMAKDGLLQIYGARTRGGLLRFSRFFQDDNRCSAINSDHITPPKIFNERELALEDRLNSAHEKLANLQRLLARKDSRLKQVIADLRVAQAGLYNLQNLLPICSSCKKIRSELGDWQQVESYFIEHAGVKFTHSICPECSHKLYPGLGLHNKG